MSNAGSSRPYSPGEFLRLIRVKESSRRHGIVEEGQKMTHAHTVNAVVAVFLSDEIIDIHAAPRQGPPAPGSMIRDRLCLFFPAFLHIYAYLNVIYMSIYMHIYKNEFALTMFLYWRIHSNAKMSNSCRAHGVKN